MSKITLVSNIINDKFTEYLYHNYDIQNKEITTTEVPLPSEEDLEIMRNDNWNIFLICGQSGSGKSTILNNAFGGVTPIKYNYEKAVISQFDDLTEEEACDLLQSVGLSSVPTWLRKPQELSNGEKARLDICKAIYEASREGKDVVIDEFTSVVHRSVAQAMSFALQRYARQKNIKIIIASCHYDIIEWVQPDYIFNINRRDENGEVEVEKMVYSDSKDYEAQQGVREEDILTEAMELPNE